ncbi:hypothetical protein OS493_029908 [Desmophyllum pertusum]|uniref:RING-type E3 ubiquitin transferase n=1 Tax=Desmophyllum pertusum TaxID=174260 RepID=A0A9W9Y8T1_9CNID|nr:hypothetical protein OS493_029908 [Desmophyllum pertusum]
MEAAADRKANGFCRYYIRGECREGDNCRFSHDSKDVPVCHYYQEGRCLFGKDCWYNHPDEKMFMPTVHPALAVFDIGAAGPGGNLNLLLAAAVAGAQTDDDNSSSDEDREREPLTLDEAMELWTRHKKRNESKLSNEEQTDADSDESSDDSNTSDCLEKHIHKFFHELRNFDMTSWDIDSVYKLVSNLAELTIKEFDEYNIALSLILGETIRHWRPDASDTAELFLRISEKDDADLSSLILTLCNAPVRVKFLESHVACILTAAQRKFTKDWTSEAIGKLLQSVEDNGFNIDATEVFHRMGKELGDAETLGRLVRDYLVATGDKDSFNCRCKTVECECPVAVDEGIAFIVFAGLERKMNWDEESKLKFFRSATDTLWTPEVLSELGELFSIKDPVKVCHPRVDKRLNWNAKEFVSTEELTAAEKPLKKSNNQRTSKCKGARCSNQPKRGCDFEMCGRCCKKVSEPCSVHEDAFSVFEPPVFERNYSFFKIEPKVFFSSRDDLENIGNLPAPFRSVTFGSDFSVHDEDLIKAVELCKDSLVVLELGSSNTGAGVWVSDTALHHIANNCPNLRKLRLESVTGATDDAVIDVMVKCPLLEELEVSGHDRSSGSLTDECVKHLFDLSVLPNLNGLIITDQMRVRHDVVYRLRRRRHNLKIIAGETDSDSFAHSMVLSMMGMDYGDGLY